MTDHEVETAIRTQILIQLKQAGIDIPVIAGFQPQNERSEKNTVMFFPVSENPQGWQKRRYHPQGSNANHTESQQYETTFRLQTCLTTSGSEMYTAKDITALIRMIVNSLPFTTALQRQHIGVPRASGIRMPDPVKEPQGDGQHPSFDFSVTFTRTLHPDTGVITLPVPDLHRI